MISGEVKRILVADGDQELVKKLAGYLNRAGYEIKVSVSGADTLAILEDDPTFDLVITALNLPEADGMEVLRRVKAVNQSIPVVVLTSQGSVKGAVEAMQAGATDFLLKPVTVELMEEVAARMLRLKKPQTPGGGPNRPIVTNDPRIRKLLEMARAVADSKATVLISGESGTGKELFARFLHDNSSRRSSAFVAVNCASLPEGLLESELFGHEKGAFTGAVSRKAGKFELADGGTILLDEISEMAVSLQAKLLRVLQENEIDRVGGKRPVPVDVRVVATTNRDMAEHIKNGEFREDLYYRLNVIPLKIPPLKERPDDILLLAQYFLEVYSAENNRPGLTLSEDTKRLLLAQGWPGNVRELQNTMERAVLLSSGGVITPEALLFEDTLVPPAVAASAAGAGGSADALGLPPTLKEAERLMIDRALDHTDGNRTHAAKILGISVRTLRNKLNEYKEGKVA
jgi:DNA-binding NtrC family response regulator